MATKKKSESADSGNGKSAGESPEVVEIVNKIGHKIAGLRRSQGLSLQQLADKSDVSAGSIHKIERSGMVPTITTLLKLSSALGMPVSYFVHEDGETLEPVQFTDSTKRRSVFTPHKGLSLMSITGSYQQFNAAGAFASMTPGATSGPKLLKHPGEELVYVLSGKVLFQVGDQDYTLEAGDSLHFSGEVPHHWENKFDENAELIWIALRDT